MATFSLGPIPEFRVLSPIATLPEAVVAEGRMLVPIPRFDVPVILPNLIPLTKISPDTSNLPLGVIVPIPIFPERVS